MSGISGVDSKNNLYLQSLKKNNSLAGSIDPSAHCSFKGNPFANNLNSASTTVNPAGGVVNPQKVNAVSPVAKSYESNPLFKNNLGKGLNQMNNVQGLFAGTYNGKLNYLNQICIA